MSNSSDNSIIPNSVIDLLVSDIFRKNGISLDKAKGNLSEEQKQMLKDLIKDLSQQVDSYHDWRFRKRQCSRTRF